MMILNKDVKFSADQILQLLKKYRESDHIENLHGFSEEERIDVLSTEDLLKKITKSFGLLREELETYVGKTVERKDLIVIAHHAIEIANTIDEAPPKKKKKKTNAAMTKDDESVRSDICKFGKNVLSVELWMQGELSFLIYSAPL